MKTSWKGRSEALHCGQQALSLSVALQFRRHCECCMDFIRKFAKLAAPCALGACGQPPLLIQPPAKGELNAASTGMACTGRSK